MIQPQPIWMNPPDQPPLLPGEVHLWRASLSDERPLRDCIAVLSRDEIVRAERFVFDEDRRHFIISHGALRRVLARYLCCDPRSIEFASGPHGKPEIAGRFMDIRFNLSHSSGLALIAVTRGRDVGVDLERIVHGVQCEEIASYYLDPREAWDVRTAPEGERVARFFDVWTRHEARLKASGAGLTGTPPVPTRFAVRSFTPAAGFAGALACEGDDWRLACWEWAV